MTHQYQSDIDTAGTADKMYAGLKTAQDFGTVSWKA